MDGESGCGGRWRASFRRWARRQTATELAARLLPPRRCRFCGAAGTRELALCAPCRRDLPIIEQGCRRCAVPLPPPLELCGPCLRQPPPCCEARCAVRYDYPADWLVQRFKFGGEIALAPTLATLMDLQAPRDWPGRAALVPVPLHRWRLLHRGYDQAAELARALGRRRGLRVLPGLLTRVRRTARQTELARARREANVAGAFAAARGAAPREVCLVDDVMTTGATVAAAAAALQAAGARVVRVWCFARAEPA